MPFHITLCISTKTLAMILIGVVLNLYVNLRRIDIFTVTWRQFVYLRLPSLKWISLWSGCFGNQSLIFDNITVSPLRRWLISLPGYPKRPRWDGGLLPLVWYAQGPWGKPRGLWSIILEFWHVGKHGTAMLRKLPWSFGFIKELVSCFLRGLRRCWHQMFRTFIFVH